MTSTIAGRQFVVSRLFHVGLTGLVLITLLAGSVRQVRSAGSQQSGPEYYFSLTRPPLKKGYLCIGEKIDIQVRVVKAFKGRENNLTGFPVTALVTGGTGTVTPEKGFLGWLLDVPEGFEFTFEAKKSGHEKIFFEATLPRKVSRGSRDKYIDHNVEFDVKECKFKTRLIYRSWQRSWSINRTGSWVEHGSMDEVLLEPDENGNFEAVGSYRLHGFETNVPECTLTWNGSDLPVNITGDLGQDVINLGFDFGFPEITASFACQSGSFTSYPAIVTATSQPKATFPTAGGVMKVAVPVANGAVAVTVILQPEAEHPAVSRTDRPVMWLSDWFEAALSLPDVSR